MCPHRLTALLTSSLLTVKGTQGCAQRYTCLVETLIQSKEYHTKAELSFTFNLSTMGDGHFSPLEDHYTLSRLSEDPAYSTLLSHGSIFLPPQANDLGENHTCLYLPNSSPTSSLSHFLILGCRMNRAPTTGYESDVGSKTTHHFVYPESYKELEENVSMILIPFKTLDLRWVVTALTTGTINLWVRAALSEQAEGVGAPTCCCRTEKPTLGKPLLLRDFPSKA